MGVSARWVLAAAAFVAAACAQAPDDPLSKWLYGLTIPIPDYSGSAKGFDFAMKDGSCTKVVVGAMTASGAPAAGTLDVAVSKFGLECSLKWSYREQSFPHLSGDGAVTAEVGDSSLATSVAVAKVGARAWPGAAKMTKCDADVKVDDLKFSGSVTAWILKILSPWIESELSSHIGAEACAGVKPLVETNATALLKTLDAGLETCARDAAADADRDRDLAGRVKAAHPAVVEWRDLPLASAAAAGLARLGECAMDDADAWRLSPDLAATFPVGDAGSVTLTLKELNVSGLETTTIDVRLLANETIGVRSRTPGRVLADALVALDVTTAASPKPLSESFVATVGLDSAAVAADLQAAVDVGPLGAKTAGAGAETEFAGSGSGTTRP